MESTQVSVKDDAGHVESDKEKRLRFKNKVLDEILSSEESYISQLDLLLNVKSHQLSHFSFFKIYLLALDRDS